jgi:HEAT repeat protein
VARFLDDVLRLLKRLREPSTPVDHAAGPAAEGTSLDELVESGDFRVVPPLLPLFATGDARSRQAAQAIATLMRGLGPSQIAWLDEQARSRSYTYGRDDAWRNLTPPAVPRLAEIAGHDVHVIGLLASHPRGFVRAAAVEALSSMSGGDEIRFLALRANDWVEPIAERAAELLAERLRPQNRFVVIDSLPFIVRMLGQQRHDHSRFAEATRTVLLSDDGQDLVPRLASYGTGVRRFTFGLIITEATSADSLLFKAAVADDDAVIRRRAVRALASRDGAETIAAGLVDLLNRDRAPIVRKEALLVLADRFPDRVRDLLPHALMDASARVRSLAQFLAREASLRPGPRDVYLTRLTSSSPRLLGAAIDGLGETGRREDYETVLSFVEALAPRVRRAALRAAARLDSDRAVSLAMDALSDGASSVRVEALNQLAVNRSRVDFAAVRARVRTLTDPRARRNALSLLREAAKWEAVVYLLEALDDPDAEVRQTASQLLDAWVRDFNRTQTVPTPQQLQHIRALLEAMASNLSQETADLLRFTVKCT